MIKYIHIITMVMSFVFITACDKDRPFDEIKNKAGASDTLVKSVIDHVSQNGKHVVDPSTGKEFSLSNSHQIPLEKQYLAVVSNTTIDKDAPVIPYEMGRQVRTILSFTEDNLIAFEIPNQFTNTDLNFKPFLKVPIRHIDFKCQEDANGKCTQKEVVDSEKTWVNKKYFQPSFADAKLETLDGLSASVRNYAFNCATELESRVISYKLSKETINITLEKTMRQNINCAGFTAFFNPSQVTYRVQQNISLVKLNKLVSKNYEPLEYQLAGPNEFGYFKTIYETRDATNKICVNCYKEYVSRWNPKKKVIDYHLSSHFEKPENATLKSATYHGVKLINESFKEAGTDMKIVLHDDSPENIEGDISKNLIVMVEDPISRGLLGYGPSITNPMTGEIVHARTVMFPGIMRMTIENAYGEFQQLIVEKELSKLNQAGSLVGSVVGLPEGLTSGQQGQLEQSLMSFKSSKPTKTLSVHQASMYKNAQFVKNQTITIPDHKHLDDSRVKILDKYYDVNQEKSIALREELEELTKNNYYPAELFNTNGAMGDIISKLVKQNDYKAWDALNKAQKEDVINQLLPVVWIPTFIHEIGHNLGLRHNFHGSKDKDNFYSESELAEKGIDRPMAYSSIMDYSYSSANELSVMGKYDVAALRFAYAEEMETVTGEMVSIKSPVDPTQIKPFDFCTDESVSLTATCNRFDEGTNYTEIVENLVKGYEERYLQRNFKRDRFDYNSTSGDVRYFSSLSRSMTIIRTVFELYEEVATDFKDQLDANPDLWESEEFLKDLKQATVLGGEFLINIVKMPDVHCLVAQETESGLELAAIVQLQNLSSNNATCFGVELAPGFSVVGQAGKSFNHIRDRSNPSASIDQIDVRGIWMDKLLALETLLQRSSSLGNFDNKVKNMLSVPELKEPILKLLTDITSDNFSGALAFDTVMGEPMTIPWDYSLFTDGTHSLNQHFHPGVRRRFGLKSTGPTVFQKLAIQEVKRHAWHEADRVLGLEIYDAFKIYDNLQLGNEEKDIETHNIGNVKYFSYPSNTIARTIIGKISSIEKVEELNKLIAAQPELEVELASIIEQRKTDNTVTQPEDKTDPFSVLSYNIDLEVLEDSVNGLLLPKEDFYELILEALN